MGKVKTGNRAAELLSFFADPDPAEFSQWGSVSSCFFNADPNNALKNVFKLPYEEFSWVEKDKKDCWKLKTMELVQIYLIFLKIFWQLLWISLHFFSFFLILFPPVSGFRRENECGSGSTPWLEKQMWHHKVLWKRMCTTVEEQN